MMTLSELATSLHTTRATIRAIEKEFTPDRRKTTFEIAKEYKLPRCAVVMIAKERGVLTV